MMPGEMMFVLGVSLVLLWPPQDVTCQYTPELEVSLLGELYNSNYSILVRPSATVTVNISFMLYTINQLNIVDQTLSVSGMLTMKWMDRRLAWKDNSDYSLVTFIFNTEENTWTPAIYVENSVEYLAVITAENMPMRITPNGEVSRTPSGVYQVSCECDVKYYPLDKQICYIKITTSGYTQNEIDLRFAKPAVDLSEYVSNGEWEIISVGKSPSGEQTKSRGGYNFASIQFRLELRRRLLFHILNTVFPVFLIGMLIPFVFKLGETGVRIDYSLTVLLSYAVYVTMIAENIPSTSVSLCYLSVYLASILTISTLSIFIVILGSKIPTREDKMSSGTRAFVRCFRKMSCCTRHSCCCRERRSVACDTNEMDVQMADTGRIHVKGNSLKAVENVPPYEEHQNREEITWEEFACVLDSLLFIVFFLFFITTSVVLFILWCIQY